MRQLSLIKKQGHLLLKNYLSISEKKLITKSFFSILSKYIDLGKNLNNFNFKSVIINKKLINLRKKNPKIFSDFYDEIGLNSSLKSIFHSKKFINLFAKILETKKEFVYVNGFMLRIDAPKDKRNSVDWHADSFFFEQTRPHFNSAVCQLPLTTFNIKNGSIEFVPYSHNINLNLKNPFGKLKFKRSSKLSTYSAVIPLSKKEKQIKKILKSSFGDASFIHLNLKHRSIKNSSDTMRVSLICRFHDTSKNFNIGKEAYIYKKTNKITLNY